MGLGYLLKTAPVLALNPPGTVRSHITHPPLPGLQKVPLALLVLPAFVVAATMSQGAGAIAQAIVGAPFIGDLLLAPVKGVIGGTILALIAGFMSHPVTGWLVDKLGGSSDARSRTAHVAMGVATMLIFVVPQVITTLLSAIIAKLSTVSSAFALLQIIPALISLVALPLLVFVQWSWWKSYGVAKWFQILMVVALVASVALGLYGAIQGIAGAVSAVRSGGSAVVEPDVPTSDTPTTIPTPDTPTGTGTATTTEPTTTAPSTTPNTTTTTPTTSLKTPEVAVPTTTKGDCAHASSVARRVSEKAVVASAARCGAGSTSG